MKEEAVAMEFDWVFSGQIVIKCNKIISISACVLGWVVEFLLSLLIKNLTESMTLFHWENNLWELVNNYVDLQCTYMFIKNNFFLIFISLSEFEWW